MENIYLSAMHCHWPMAIIDMDHKSVVYSGTYSRHQNLKKKAQFYQVLIDFVI